MEDWKEFFQSFMDYNVTLMSCKSINSVPCVVPLEILYKMFKDRYRGEMVNEAKRLMEEVTNSEDFKRIKPT